MKHFVTSQNVRLVATIERSYILKLRLVACIERSYSVSLQSVQVVMYAQPCDRQPLPCMKKLLFAAQGW